MCLSTLLQQRRAGALQLTENLKDESTLFKDKDYDVYLKGYPSPDQERQKFIDANVRPRSCIEHICAFEQTHAEAQTNPDLIVSAHCYLVSFDPTAV